MRGQSQLTFTTQFNTSVKLLCVISLNGISQPHAVGLLALVFW
ncbi:Uncharacterised protein [Vibrio cholerae]|nr:Uncharacterised protein [Vibrio cholerae]